MGLGSWVENRVEDIKDGVGKVEQAVVAPVVGVVADVGEKAGAVGGALLGAARRYLDGLAAPQQPMPGGTNWDAYSHEQLYAMVHERANHGQVGGLAGDWGQTGERMVQNADQLTRLVDTLRAHWSGEAADQAADTLREQSAQLRQVGTWIDSVHQAVSNAGEALRVAQQTMPQPLPDTTALTVAGAAGGAVTGVIGGPVGMALGAIRGAAVSQLAQAAARNELKAQAVQVMQTYEAGLGAAAVGPPPPGTGSTSPPGGAATGGPVGHGAGVGIALPGPRSAAPARRGAAPAAPARTGTSGAVGTQPASPPPATGAESATSAAAASPTVLSAAPTSGGAGGTGSVPWRELTGRGSLPGLFTGVAGAGGLAAGRLSGTALPGRGAGMRRDQARATASGDRSAEGQGGVMPAPAALGGAGAGRDEEDREHRNKMPTDGKLFAVDRTPPPVIGA